MFFFASCYIEIYSNGKATKFLHKTIWYRMTFCVKFGFFNQVLIIWLEWKKNTYLYWLEFCDEAIMHTLCEIIIAISAIERAECGAENRISIVYVITLQFACVNMIYLHSSIHPLLCCLIIENIAMFITKCFTAKNLLLKSQYWRQTKLSHSKSKTIKLKGIYCLSEKIFQLFPFFYCVIYSRHIFNLIEGTMFTNPMAHIRETQCETKFLENISSDTSANPSSKRINVAHFPRRIHGDWYDFNIGKCEAADRPPSQLNRIKTKFNGFQTVTNSYQYQDLEMRLYLFSNNNLLVEISMSVWRKTDSLTYFMYVRIYTDRQTAKIYQWINVWSILWLKSIKKVSKSS